MDPKQIKVTSTPVFQTPTLKSTSKDVTFKIPHMVPFEELQKRSPIMCTAEVPRIKPITNYSTFPQLCLSKSIKDQIKKNKGNEILSISPDIFKPILPFPIITQANPVFPLQKAVEAQFSANLKAMQHDGFARKKTNLDFPQIRKECKCEKCEKVCKTPAALKAHMITHSEIKPFQCLQCSKFFKSENGVLSHLKIGHKMLELEVGKIEQYYTKVPVENLPQTQDDPAKGIKMKEAKKRGLEGGAKDGGVKKSRTGTSGAPGGEVFTFSHGLPPAVKLALLADLSQEQIQEKKIVDKLTDPPSMDHAKQFVDLNWPCFICDAVLSFKQTFALHMSRIHSMRVVCDACKRVYKDENTLKQHYEAVHVN